MRHFKLTIEYDGTFFNGWQIQSKRNRTVQGEIELTLKKIFKKKVRIAGSGRTDSGVHALGQIASFFASTRMTASEVKKALNANLPDDIVICDASEVSRNFHARFSSKRKLYRYSILNRTLPTALQRQYCFFFPSKLNLRLMRAEAQQLLGKKDYRCFMAADLEVRKRGFEITIIASGEGFLYKMVRNIVGTLLEIGTGKAPKGSMRRILDSRDRNYAGDTAPACGLCLVCVKY